MRRRKTTVISVGNVKIGGKNPIVVQAMAKSSIKDIHRAVKEINNLAKAGAKIVRVAVPDEESAKALREIKKMVSKNMKPFIFFSITFPKSDQPWSLFFLTRAPH